MYKMGFSKYSCCRYRYLDVVRVLHSAKEMATLEKLVRTVEALKLHQTPSVTVDETMAKKDKIAHCVSVTDMICSQVVLN